VAAGLVLFVSSLHHRFVAEDAHYGVSKAGVAMLVRVRAKQLAGHHIRVNPISPGWIRTAEDVTTSEQLEKYAPSAPDSDRAGWHPRQHCPGRAVPAQ
jgi:NAD(P)-dependent dehydrogenase (short-subunit alcohol dehydrogenase family)